MDVRAAAGGGLALPICRVLLISFLRLFRSRVLSESGGVSIAHSPGAGGEWWWWRGGGGVVAENSSVGFIFILFFPFLARALLQPRRDSILAGRETVCN